MSVGARTKRLIAVGLIALATTACADTGAAPEAGGSLSMTLTEGSVLWLRAGARLSIRVSSSVRLGWNDQVWSPPDAGATLQLPDGSSIRAAPNTGLRLHRPYTSDARPVVQLLMGEINVTATSDNYLIESYREVSLSPRIVVVNMILNPKGNPSQFRLAFVNDMAEADVYQGAVDVRASDLSGTLQADWHARLAPGEDLRIISPFNFTPTISPFATATRTPTPTPTYAPSATATPTATATQRILPTATATAAIVPPTNTPEPKEPPPPPRPTKPPAEPPPPTEPPPTEPPPPPPDTPEPTSRPTPGS